MSDWRDDLPRIPADRIRNDAIREGTSRRARRQRRQRTILLGGMGAAAVAAIVAAGVLTRAPDTGDDAASTVVPSDTEAVAATTSPPATESPADTEAAGTEAAATTAAAATGTTAATEDTAAEATTAATGPVDYTTVGGSAAELPVDTDIVVVPATIWEQPLSGPACGPTSLELVIPRSLGLTYPVARWQTADLSGEVPMIVEAGNAHATIGPFGQETLSAGVRYELLVVVVGIDLSGGEQFVRAPSAVLIDCS